MEDPAVIFPHIDHPAADEAIAKNTDALVIEGMPFTESVQFLQHPSFLIKPDMPVPHADD